MRRPRLRAGTKLRHDRHSNRWLLIGPERALVLNETALAIVELCNGDRTESDMVGELATRFEALPAKIEADIASLLIELRRRCLVEDDLT